MTPNIIVSCDSCNEKIEIPCYWIAKGRRLLGAKIDFYIKEEGWTTKDDNQYCPKCSTIKK